MKYHCTLTAPTLVKIFNFKLELEKSSSFTDYKAGFGGKFGVQSDRVDKSAVGWDHHEQLNKHESQVWNIMTGSS